MPLFNWQEPISDKAYNSLQNNRMFVNACTTGAGKTFICCDVIRRMKTPHLIIAPKASHTQWLRVAQDMDVLPYILDVTNPEQLSKTTGCRWYTREGLWKLPENTTVVFDEIHRGASGISKMNTKTGKPTAITTRAVAQLKAFPGSKLHAMSATTACDPLHLQALGYWAGMHGFNERSFYAWCRRHGCRDVSLGDRGSMFQFTRKKKEAAEIMQEIRADFGDRFCALGPDEIPGFPGQIVRTKLIDLRKRDRQEIEAAYKEMSLRMKTRALAQIAEGGRERERIEFIMAGALSEIVLNSVADGNSVVVFFNFTEPRERFVAGIRTVYAGGISQVYGNQKDNRQANIDAFQANQNYLMVVNLSAGGVSLNLHDVLHQRPRESFIIPSYDAAAIRQALGRIRRVEGTFATQTFVIAAGTIQERVKVNLDLKTRNIDALNNGDLFPVQP